ncbi:hypothetical protein BD289DRAFT_18372 [Coniella lustricola]|uniref:Uncharacterized protein n=1 Tax=Coniella lustricola TaxID=2025994 RepID=A0A2T3AJB7_9PEZI|nr:hypothetical protein BD289DRAFT_18372 [Coniella lustricola]
MGQPYQHLPALQHWAAPARLTRRAHDMIQWATAFAPGSRRSFDAGQSEGPKRRPCPSSQHDSRSACSRDFTAREAWHVGEQGCAASMPGPGSSNGLASGWLGLALSVAALCPLAAGERGIEKYFIRAPRPRINICFLQSSSWLPSSVSFHRLSKPPKA